MNRQSSLLVETDINSITLCDNTQYGNEEINVNPATLVILTESKPLNGFIRPSSMQMKEKAATY